MLLSNCSKKEWFFIGAGVMIYILGLLYSAAFDLNYLCTSFQEFTMRLFVCIFLWIVPGFASSVTKVLSYQQGFDFHSFQYLFGQDGSFIGSATFLLFLAVVFFVGGLLFDYIDKNSSNEENESSFEKKMKTSRKIQITLPSSTITMVIVIVVSYFLAAAKFNQTISTTSGFVMAFTCVMLLGAIAEGGTYEFIEPKQEEPVIKGEVE